MLSWQPGGGHWVGTVEGRGCGSPGTREAPPRRAAETAPRLAADGRAGQRGPSPQPPALAGPKVSLGGAGRTKALLCSGSGLLPDGTSHRRPQEATGSPFLGPDCGGSHLRQGLPSPWDGAGRKGRAQEPRTQDWGPSLQGTQDQGGPRLLHFRAPPLPGPSTSGPLHFRAPPLPGSPRSAGVAPGSLATAAPAPAGAECSLPRPHPPAMLPDEAGDTTVIQCCTERGACCTLFQLPFLPLLPAPPAWPKGPGTCWPLQAQGTTVQARRSLCPQPEVLGPGHAVQPWVCPQWVATGWTSPVPGTSPGPPEQVPGHPPPTFLP
ncbi:uncharacterized protein CXorf49-like [Macaca nemestrina]|uniref:uncharacterized protein CXorf49-like n=1 Tax=Macaca nemestrina TaxID=9545 RepID=UPI0039B8BEF0